MTDNRVHHLNGDKTAEESQTQLDYGNNLDKNCDWLEILDGDVVNKNGHSFKDTSHFCKPNPTLDPVRCFPYEEAEFPSSNSENTSNSVQSTFICTVNEGAVDANLQDTEITVADDMPDLNELVIPVVAPNGGVKRCFDDLENLQDEQMPPKRTYTWIMETGKGPAIQPNSPSPSSLFNGSLQMLAGPTCSYNFQPKTYHPTTGVMNRMPMGSEFITGHSQCSRWANEPNESFIIPSPMYRDGSSVNIYDANLNNNSNILIDYMEQHASSSNGGGYTTNDNDGKSYGYIQSNHGSNRLNTHGVSYGSHYADPLNPQLLPFLNAAILAAAAAAAANAVNGGKKSKRCSNCGTISTPSWRRCPAGKNLLCNACGLYQKLHAVPRPIQIGRDGSVRCRRSPPPDTTEASQHPSSFTFTDGTRNYMNSKSFDGSHTSIDDVGVQTKSETASINSLQDGHNNQHA